MRKKLPVIIDTDPGTDDALALAAASVFLKDRLKIFVSSYGNVNGEKTFKNLCGLVKALKLKGEVLKGSMARLDGKEPEYTEFHGKDGICGVTLPQHEENAACAFPDRLFEALKNIGPAVYLAFGPLTNLARLLKEHPEASGMISKVIIMGGGFSVCNSPGGAEYNFAADPEAVEAVLQSQTDKILVPLDVTHQTVFSKADIDEITASKDTYDLLKEILFQNFNSGMKFGENGAIIHDAVTVAYLADKNQFVTETKKITVDSNGALSLSESGFEIRVVKRINPGFLKDFFMDVFCQL